MVKYFYRLEIYYRFCTKILTLWLSQTEKLNQIKLIFNFTFFLINFF
jgi:hypothetical protein